MENLVSFHDLPEDVLALPGHPILKLLVVVKDVGVEHLREGGRTSPTSRLEHTLEYVGAFASRMLIHELQNLNIPPIGGGVLEGICNLAGLVSRLSIGTADNIHMTHSLLLY
jgi:hypothetical protein